LRRAAPALLAAARITLESGWGSIANLIVVQRAAASGVTIGFWDYFRVGAPLTLITLTIGTLWLSL
jgi:Na+/H+ antiporter NhaD/arsenite permease-like protein